MKKIVLITILLYCYAMVGAQEIAFRPSMQNIGRGELQGQNRSQFIPRNDSLTTLIIQQRDYSVLLKYLSAISDNALETVYYRMVQTPYIHGWNSDTLHLYAEAIYKEKRVRLNKEADGETTNIYEIWKEQLSVLVKLRDKCGDPVGAIALADTLKTVFNYKSADFNAFYMQLLQKHGQEEKAMTYNKNCIKENMFSLEMLTLLKQEYLKNGGREEEFQAYLDGLKSKEKLAIQKQEVLCKLTNRPIRLSEIDCLDGKRVDLNKLKGKIIVLDFWATWCAPCKAAMEGMQLVVNHYEKDSEVMFFFISTMERDKDYKTKIENFLKSKNYHLPIALDEFNPTTKRRDLLYTTHSHDLKISGIPRKIIIDQKGNLRWLGTGYSGSPSALADEIRFVVEYLKNEE
nr:TlpA disulfide reductase family protein [Odoribacter splanchnicus]